MSDRETLLRIISIHSDIARLGLDLQGVMSLVVDSAVDLVGADCSAIELVEGSELVYRAVSGTSRKALGTRVARQGSLSGLCLEQGGPMICMDAQTDTRVDQAACRRIGIRSMVVLPLIHRDEPVGVLKCMSSQPHRFGQTHAEALRLLSTVVGAAMYWATKYSNNDLFYRATHDDMTGLANRALFMDRLHHTVSNCLRNGSSAAVLMIDMDGLKAINDELGHRAGDEAIVEFARRLSTVTREADTLARLGGDEFAVLLCSQHISEGLPACLKRFEQATSFTMVLRGQERIIRGSVGAAICAEDAGDPLQLVEIADLNRPGFCRHLRASNLRTCRRCDEHEAIHGRIQGRGGQPGT